VRARRGKGGELELRTGGREGETTTETNLDGEVASICEPNAEICQFDKKEGYDEKKPDEPT